MGLSEEESKCREYYLALSRALGNAHQFKTEFLELFETLKEMKVSDSVSETATIAYDFMKHKNIDEHDIETCKRVLNAYLSLSEFYLVTAISTFNKLNGIDNLGELND